jgi:hypothetical protein
VAWPHVLRVRELQLPSIPKLILYALASRADRHGYCWPSVRRICADSGLHRRAVQIHLARLTAAGWLVREQRIGRSNGFRLALGTYAPERSVDQSREAEARTEAKVAGPGPARTGTHEPGIEMVSKTEEEVRTSCAPPAHVVRPPAHHMRARCARDAPEVEREDFPKEQKKAPPDAAVGDKSSQAHSANGAAWWHSKPAVMAQAIRLGISALPGEDYRRYKDRVFEVWQATIAERRTGARSEDGRAPTQPVKPVGYRRG